jgi:hypothetical protein
MCRRYASLPSLPLRPDTFGVDSLQSAHSGAEVVRHRGPCVLRPDSAPDSEEPQRTVTVYRPNRAVFPPLLLTENHL